MRPAAAFCALAATLACAAAAHAQTPALDLRALAPQADTFAFQAMGRTFGTQIVTLVREADGSFTMRETTSVQAMSQTTEVRLDATGAMRSTRQQGQAAGQQMQIEVDYAAGRATGRARVPQQGGMKDVVVDAAVPADALDDNTFVALLQAMPWTAQSVFEVPVFSSGNATLETRTLRVTGTEQVTVPAGTFDAWRVEVTGEPALVVFLATAAPHRVLRMEVVGTPMTIVRMNAAR
jgi:hypothetical protein